MSPWDMAAGMLMVREAGGFVTDIDGGDAHVRHNGTSLPATRRSTAQLQTLLKAAGKALIAASPNLPDRTIRAFAMNLQ